MTVRLSEESVIQALDTGWQSLAWTQQSTQPLVLSDSVNFNAILDAKDPLSAAQAVPRRDMYLAILDRGPDDALDILPLLSTEQFVAIIDHEAWSHDQLAPHQAIKWLNFYKNLGLEQLYKRYRELDEEYQVAIVSPYVELVDGDTYETFTQDLQDKFAPMPCNTMWWRVKNDDQVITEFVAALIEASISEDTGYIYTLLGMATMMPPHEQEALLKQFRDARLEEDGFVSQVEGQELFAPFDGIELYDRWKKKQFTSQLVSPSNVIDGDSSSLFLNTVMNSALSSGRADHVALDNLRHQIVYLANALSSSCHVAPDDLNGLKMLLTHVQSSLSFGLEALSGRDLVVATDIIFTEYPKNVFKFALSTFSALREQAIAHIKTIRPDVAKKLDSYWRSGKFGAALWLIDKELLEVIGFDRAETLKGLFNRFPMVKLDMVDHDGTPKTRYAPVSSLRDFSKLSSQVMVHDA